MAQRVRREGVSKIYALIRGSGFSSGEEIDALFSLLFHPFFLPSDLYVLPYEETDSQYILPLTLLITKRRTGVLLRKAS